MSESPRTALADPEDREPTAAELAAIEAEWPLIEAELDVLDAEIEAAQAGVWVGPLHHRRLRTALRRLLEAKAERVYRRLPELYAGLAALEGGLGAGTAKHRTEPATSNQEAQPVSQIDVGPGVGTAEHRTRAAAFTDQEKETGRASDIQARPVSQNDEFGAAAA